MIAHGSAPLNLLKKKTPVLGKKKINSASSRFVGARDIPLKKTVKERNVNGTKK